MRSQRSKYAERSYHKHRRPRNDGRSTLRDEPQRLAHLEALSRYYEAMGVVGKQCKGNGKGVGAGTGGV